MKSITILLIVFVCVMITLVYEHAVRLTCQQTLGPWIIQMRQPFLRNILQLIEPYLKKDGRILDLFPGLGSTSHALKTLGYYNVVSLDTTDSIHSFDGLNIPFPDKSFRVVLALCCLHEVFYTDELLAEMARVGQIVIVVEHVIQSPFQCYSIPFSESVTSWHFTNHPHNNLADHVWKSKFEAAGLTLLREWELDGVVFHHKMYILGSGSDEV